MTGYPGETHMGWIPRLLHEDPMEPWSTGPGGCGSVEVVASTKLFRQLAKCRPHDGDRILEIGCCFGQCTVILSQRAAEVLALDTSKECVEATMERLKEADVTMIARSLRFNMLAHPELLRILASCMPPFKVTCLIVSCDNL